jgi:hypothetical protein
MWRNDSNLRIKQTPVAWAHIALGLGLWLGLAGAAGAQGVVPRSVPLSQPISVGVSPQLVSLRVTPGATPVIQVRVKNYSATTDARVWITSADAQQELEGHIRFAPPGSVRQTCAPWMNIAVGPYIVPRGKEIMVPVTIQVPAVGIRGTYHGIIAVALTPPMPTPEELGVPIATGMRVAFGIIVHLEIPGTREESAVVSAMSFTSVPPSSQSVTGPEGTRRWMMVRIANDGNCLLYLDGWVMLRSAQGQLAQRWQVGSRIAGERRVLYPGRMIDVQLPIKTGLAAGDYIAECRLNYGEKKVAGAKGTVTIEQGGDIPETAAGAFASLAIGLALTVNEDLRTVAVAPGGVRTGSLTVRNNESNPMRVAMDIRDARMEPDGTVLGYGKDQADPYAAAAWLKVMPTTFTLAAGEARKLQCSVRMPKRGPGAELRDVMGIVRFEGHLLNANTRKTGPESIGECSVVVIAGPDRAGVRKCEVGLPQIRVLPEANNLILLGLEVQNTGGVYCRLAGSLLVHGITNPVFTWEAALMEGQPMVFAGSSRMLWIRLPSDQFGPGEYLADVTVNYGGADAIIQKVKINLMRPPGDDAPKPSAASAPANHVPAVKDRESRVNHAEGAGQ